MSLDSEGLVLVTDDRRFLVQKDNTIALLYAHRGYTNKPYLPVLRGPSGRNVLEDSPGDHVHHHGVWWGHGDVNGVDYYLEVPAPGRRLGRIDHVGYDEITDDNPRFGFAESLSWIDDTGDVVLTESRIVLAHFRDETHYTVDLDSTYTATRNLAFGDTKESVLPSLRIAEALTAVCGGHIRSSHGGKGEGRTMGVPAQWIDYWGERKANYGLADVTEGIACFDHPSNPNHPNPFFVRAYGPVSPFQGHYFTGPASLAEGESWRYRHRLVVHYGDTTEARIADRYREWTEEVP
jgi:hypothetical protein